MEQKIPTRDNKIIDIVAGLISAIFINVIFVGGAILQTGVLFHMKFTENWIVVPPITNLPLWAGAFLWVMFAIVSWVMVRQDRNVPSIFFAIIIHGVAAASIAGIFSPDFLKFAHWTNAILWVLMGVGCVSATILESKKGWPFTFNRTTT